MMVPLSDESRVPFDGILDYSFSNFHDCLSLDHEALDLLKLDCHEAFTCRSILNSDESYSSGSTYFMKSDHAPRCQLEQLALSIFRLHTKDAIFSAELSGAEWWTQVIDCRDDIGFHWDRDYGLEEDTGQHIHPHLATVTYLTDLGGPTLILNKVGTRHATECLSGIADEIIVSRPMFGKHIKFDGRLLHAAPCDLLELEDESITDERGDDSEEDSSDSSSTSDDTEISEPILQTDATVDESTSSSSKRSGWSGDTFSDINSKEAKNGNDDDYVDDDDAGFPKRITFLVNIWLNHIPTQSSEFPADRLCNLQTMSNHPQTSTSLKLGCNKIKDNSVEVSMPSDDTFHCDKVFAILVPTVELSSTLNLNEESDDKYLNRKWKFSNSGMKYEVTIPLPPINRLQSLAIDYDAFRLFYDTSGVSARVDSIMSKKRKAMQNYSNNTSS